MTAKDIRTLEMISSNCNLEKVQRDMLTEIIEKQNKYAWHDLRKDPNDLPEEVTAIDNGKWSDDILVCGLYDTEIITAITDYCVESDGGEGGWIDAIDSRGRRITEIIAWRYIEPLQEAEE